MKISLFRKAKTLTEYEKSVIDEVYSQEPLIAIAEHTLAKGNFSGVDKNLQDSGVIWDKDKGYVKTTRISRDLIDA